MSKRNAANIRIVRDYLIYLREARRLSEASVDTAAAAIASFEHYTKGRDFKAFRIEQAIAFKRYLARKRSDRTGAPLSPRTMATTLNALRSFFQWLAGQPGFRSRLTYADADYFQLPEKEARASRTSTERHTPSVEQIRHVVALMPHGTDLEKRDRALVAFTLLTGTRDGATASLRFKHVDLEAGRVDHDPREVRTKFSKSYLTYFFPVGDDLRQIIHDWVRHLRENLLFGPDDPLFPATKIGLDAVGLYSRQGLARAGWTTATPIRRVFAAAFAAAGLPYANPHSFRRTLARLGEQCCRTPEEFKAWSQNLGHEHVLTTFISYGSVTRTRQADIMKYLGHRPADRMSITSEIVRLAQQLGGGVPAAEG